MKRAGNGPRKTLRPVDAVMIVVGSVGSLNSILMTHLAQGSHRLGRKAASQASRSALLLLVSVLALPLTAWSHGAFHHVTWKEAVVITAEYDDGEPMSYAEVRIHPPAEAKAAHQVGHMDRRGRFAFVPDAPGQWRITIDGGMGHLVEASVSVNEAHGLQGDPEGGRPSSRWQGIAAGLGVIFGLSGILYSLRAGRRNRAPG
ncbi:MAG: DUF4198 domain-containing protein [Syntrophobacteraceae bacterium]|jgi:nickel transport protein|nr:DUF4198 domain-containing protein [Syntrophobacteraceae bacterium]